MNFSTNREKMENTFKITLNTLEIALTVKPTETSVCTSTYLVSYCYFFWVNLTFSHKNLQDHIIYKNHGITRIYKSSISVEKIIIHISRSFCVIMIFFNIFGKSYLFFGFRTCDSNL